MEEYMLNVKINIKQQQQNAVAACYKLREFPIKFSSHPDDIFYYHAHVFYNVNHVACEVITCQINYHIYSMIIDFKKSDI